MKFWLAMIVTLMLGACASSSGPAGNPIPESMKAPDQSAEDYKIGVDDQVAINVWGNPDLSVNLPVRPDGKISMPLVGDVQVGGLTAEEVASGIQTRLATYLRDPHVTVMLVGLRSHEFISRVRVTGAVQQQVSIPFRQGMTVLDAVLEAGGTTEFASLGKTKLHRKVGSDVQVFEVPLDRIMNEGDLSANVQLRPGDTITVPERLF